MAFNSADTNNFCLHDYEFTQGFRREGNAPNEHNLHAAGQS